MAVKSWSGNTWACRKMLEEKSCVSGTHVKTDKIEIHIEFKSTAPGLQQQSRSVSWEGQSSSAYSDNGEKCSATFGASHVYVLCRSAWEVINVRLYATTRLWGWLRIWHEPELLSFGGSCCNSGCCRQTARFDVQIETGAVSKLVRHRTMSDRIFWFKIFLISSIKSIQTAGIRWSIDSFACLDVYTKDVILNLLYTYSVPSRPESKASNFQFLPRHIECWTIWTSSTHLSLHIHFTGQWWQLFLTTV